VLVDKSVLGYDVMSIGTSASLHVAILQMMRPLLHAYNNIQSCTCFIFSFAGKLKLPSEGKGQYYVYFHSSWRLDAHVPCDVCPLP
jgi:hypothetical protein